MSCKDPSYAPNLRGFDVDHTMQRVEAVRQAVLQEQHQTQRPILFTTGVAPYTKCAPVQQVQALKQA